METFIVDYNTGISHTIEAENLTSAKDTAYDGMSYTQQDVTIKDVDGNELTRSEWHGVRPHEGNDDDVLCVIGDGHYLLWDDELL